jgi:hypothetical protein
VNFPFRLGGAIVVGNCAAGRFFSLYSGPSLLARGNLAGRVDRNMQFS